MTQGDPAVSPNVVPQPDIDRSHAIPNFRWFICALLFFATTVNYMDRMVLGILKPVIAQDLHWTENQYGTIIACFQAGYAVMMLVAGWLIDKLGTRIGYIISATVWSISSMSHALAGNAFQFGLARLGLGLGEAANFPAAIKTVATWFPRRERALATGVFNSGSNVGAVVAPLLVPIMAARFGWHSAFLLTGSLSMLWVILWSLTYREPDRHRRLSTEELALIRSDQEETQLHKVPYGQLLTKRAAWALIMGKFLTDPVWWFYLNWLPGFLHDNYKLDLTHIGPPLIAIYVSADVGSVGGGWISSSLITHNCPVGKARKIAMLICALAVTAAIFVPNAHGNLWLTVGLVSIAAAAHQGWSANLYTIASDCFPKSAVGSVVGLAGFGGAVGGAFAAKAIGAWLNFSHEVYGPLFLAAGSMYLLALLVIQLLIPRYKMAS
ncbi:MAG TPA: MFS transporter [Bryobacteraceae bacterium]|jgi:ACS family hexuronate transporter-like MFS transporter|nr:MFS transporter [Bryobacteraceae bacterium]